MLYKDDKGFIDATYPSKGVSAKAWGHKASSLPLLDSTRQSQKQINAVGLDARHFNVGLCVESEAIYEDEWRYNVSMKIWAGCLVSINMNINTSSD